MREILVIFSYDNCYLGTMRKNWTHIRQWQYT